MTDWNLLRQEVIPEDTPNDRCGLTVNYVDISQYPGSVTCWREPWRDHDRCIWHADVSDKPADELTAARSNMQERLDGAVLQSVAMDIDMNFAGCVLIGAQLADTSLYKADLTNANLLKVDFTNALLARAELTGAFLRAADLTDATLVNADLTNADLTNADLTNANFQGANLSGVRIVYTNLDEIELDEGTTFGGRSRWEAEADENAAAAIPYLPWQFPSLRALGRPFTDPDDLEQAELQYRATQRILRENDLRQLPEIAIREKHARRKRALAERDCWTWFKLAFYRWPLGYGERVRNVLGTSAVVIVGFAAIYPFVGGMEATEDDATPYAFGNLLDLSVEMPEAVEIIWANLYFSVVTFSTLGYGDIQPATGAAQGLASVQSLLGALLMAYLVFVLGRRTTW